MVDKPARVSPVDVVTGRALVVARRRAEVLPGPEINRQPIAWKAAAAFGAGPLCMAAAMTHPSVWMRVGLGTVGVAVSIVDGAHVFRHFFGRKTG
jgi:hypothetical protein